MLAGDAEDAAVTGVDGLGVDDRTMPLVSVFGAAEADAAATGGGVEALKEGADDWRADADLDAVLTGANEDEAVVSAAAEATAWSSRAPMAALAGNTSCGMKATIK
jgi:hypothetical protein